MKKKRTVKQQLVIGCISLGVLVVLGSLQVVFSPYTFVRGVMIISVIACSAGIGAYIREIFILKKSKQLNE
ncbi:hypothetical protein ACFVR1_16210 [Psychrobacillus sp. NPDC058041]|uniref:hypothetical protein n=1 Tax=Psychrobacillus sp. NPDC058041 TaxID=3346310 RepID=UPI0036D992CE